MIVFDVQALQSEAFGERGIGRYTADLGVALAGIGEPAVDVFAWNDSLPRTRALDAFGSERAVGDRLRPFSQLRGGAVDLVHVNAPFEMAPYGDVVVPVRARRTVVTCYDLIPLRFPAEHLPDAFDRARYRTRLGLLAAADAIVADSASAAADLVELAGVSSKRVHVVGAGVGERFAPSDGPLETRLETLRETLPDLETSFVFVPSGFTWRKNIAGTLRAYADLPAELRSRHQLVLSCALDDGARRWVESEVSRLGIDGRVVATGHVADEVLVALYQTASLVFFPSYYEGFGLPVLEARRCGARVICSAASSLPEVLPDPRALFDPWDHDDVVDHLERALTDEAFGVVLDAVPDPGFSWDRTAAAVSSVYGATLASRRPIVDRPVRRLGVVTPLRPAATGVADHSERILRALDERNDVEVVAFAPHPFGGPDDRPYETHSLVDLPDDWARGRLDSILYCFGNNRIHREFLRILRLAPGHVLLHDVRLTEMYGSHERGAAERSERASDGGPFHLLPVVSRAVGVLVQSQHAAGLVRAATGRDAVDIGPHHCAPSGLADRPAGPPLVVSAGYATPEKQSGKVAAAMRAVVLATGARAAFVGAWGEYFVDPDDPIETTGPVDDESFDRWLRAADVMVQLRATTNGESSGVVAHALARGVPVVVTDIGAMSELPDDAVVKVPVDVTADDLAHEIEQLLADPDRRERCRRAALDFAARQTPAVQADRIVTAIFGSSNA